jgi:hypothetical protein
VGRKRISSNATALLPEGLYLHGRQFGARLPGNKWTYFGSERSAAVNAHAKWLQTGPSIKIDIDRAVKIKLKRREKKLLQANAIARQIDPIANY